MIWPVGFARWFQLKSYESKNWRNLKHFFVDKDTRQSCGWSHQKCNKIQISELRKVNREKTPKDSSTKIPFVVTHNPRNHNTFNASRHCLPVQHHSKTFKNIIKKTYFIYSWRQPPNLKKFLQETNLFQRKKYFGWKCEDFRCGTYAYIQKGQAILFKNGTVFKVISYINCRSKNIIYCKHCPIRDQISRPCEGT